ncbi:ParB N-terminal domain-containing protein [Streptomyces sp. NPDC088925]|uniref:ParB N-terminal domain-containing protein n=1 Tax=Streptomyces sp. NPDC088925 TaxID=3365914 RepID=UPI00381194EF
MPKFVAEYPLVGLRPAPYNPRRLDDDAFERLKQSIALFGCVKPVLINGNNILVAGHQRTKTLLALGHTTTPAMLLDSHVSTHDEINFNLLHNSVETDSSRVTVTRAEETRHGWEWISHADLQVRSRGGARVRSELGRLTRRYGPWGSIVADHDGRVILNADYATVAKDLRTDVLCFRVSAQEADELLVHLGGEYGVYDFSQLGIKAYNQHWCQMHRLGGDEGDSAKSGLYEGFVLPSLRREDRIVDFGAGEAAYISRLASQGHNAHWYEPHVKANGVQGALDVAASVAQIRDLHRDVNRSGLYDVVVLDSVINSVTSVDFEDYVLTACSTLTADDGTFYTATRDLKQVEQPSDSKKSRSNRYHRTVEYLDENRFSATFRRGVWTMQHFHTTDTLRRLLVQYFGEVRMGRTKHGGVAAVCRRPLPMDPARRRKALEVEFNMEYPGEYRHNRHRPLVQTLLEKTAKRDGIERN